MLIITRFQFSIAFFSEVKKMCYNWLCVDALGFCIAFIFTLIYCEFVIHTMRQANQPNKAFNAHKWICALISLMNQCSLIDINMGSMEKRPIIEYFFSILHTFSAKSYPAYLVCEIHLTQFLCKPYFVYDFFIIIFFARN